MKAKTKLTKLWSFLLSLVMLFSLLPTTALAASPDASNVYVNGNINFYNPTRLYYKNGDSDASFTGTSTDFNAAYDPATGTLTLKDYNGKGITVGGVGRTDIIVVLKGTNIINDGSLENAVGGDITVTSSDGGTLSITRTLSNGNPAIGIETGWATSYETGNVTITGDAKVTIDMTHNGTQGFDKAYGIFAKENITISEKASVDITCKTPNNTAIDASNCNGLRAVKDVIIDTSGEVKINVTEAGQNDAYSIGVYPSGDATLTRAGDMAVEWKNHGSNGSYTGGAIYGDKSFDTSTHAVNVDTNNRYASYRYGTPYSVTVKNGTLTGPGVKYANRSGNFLKNDIVNITPDTKTGASTEEIPFKEWTAEGVTITNSDVASNSFTVPANAVTVTATHSPFVGTPTFTRESEANGMIAFKTAVKPNDGTEFFQYVEVGKENDPYGYQSISSQPTTASTVSPYEYSVTASTGYTTVIQYLNAGNYRMAVTLNGTRYLSDPFNVDYTAPVTTYTVSFDANGGTGTMADVTGVSGEYMLPANGFTAPAGKQFKAWSVGGSEKAVGDKITVTANTTVTAVWENTPVVTYTVSFDANGGTGTMADVTGVSGEYTLPANGFTAPAGKQFKAWSVGGVEKAAGDKITVTANTTVTAVWEAIEYNVTVTGGTASVGAGTPITKATMGTTVTLTAGAAPTGKVFDEWKVVSGGITLADANSATTTFTMPAEAVSVQATYKNAPHTHTYNQETVKPEALKTPADCTSNAVYFKSCSCGAISTTDTFVAMNTALGHAYGSDWKYDSTNHWHECSRCHDKKNEAAHDYGSDNVCDTCGYDKTVPHTHNLTLVAAKAATCTTAGNSAYYTCDGCDKWFEDATGSVEITDKTSVEIAPLNHDWNAPAYTWNADNTVCTATRTCKRDAGHKETATATVTSAQTKAPTCTAKGETTYTAAFTEAWANTQTKTVDNIAALGHDWSTAWTGDSTGHWHKCTRCDATTTKAAHDYGSDNVCDTCGYDKTVPHTHNLTLVAAKAATCTTAGNSAYYTCDGCDKWFADATGSVEITDKNIVKIPATGHTAGTEWKSDDTNHWHECTVAGCGVIIESTKSAHTASDWIIDTPATATTAGTKYKECTVCHRVLETQTIPSTGTELKIIAGDNQIYNKASGSDVTITCNGDFAKFTGIKVDGSVVDSSNYTAVSGSTVLTLKASYLGTLTDGSHTITFVYTDGEANTNLTVRTAGSEHIHDYGTEWKSNADNHWHECNCGDKKDEAAHSFKWVVDKEATATKKGSKHEECKTCGYKRPAVEIPATGTTTAPTDTTKPNDTTKPGNTNGSEKSPQTGDNSNIFLWFALLFVSVAGVTGITVYNKKKKEHAE